MLSRRKRILLKLKRKYLFIFKLVNRNKYMNLFYQHMREMGINMPEQPEFISDDVYLDEVGYSLISIEKGVTISKGVTLLVHDFSVTQPLRTYEDNVLWAEILRHIQLKRGCFIGANSIILPGTTIGENSIVGAGSVVKGEIPDNVVIAGNPAKVIKTIEEYYHDIKKMQSDEVKIWYKE
ncbi:acyltransferase [Priestia megaterium]|uniref:acyltransferase n=1 Tax=Priestia megaterium TaxID=1404 RepID=UPI00237913B2|nr:acyltransferase [Priestia megaterium]MED3973227.1 acyltransferase [Priestia megaterium]WDM33087.1 acyltransferase [Priestia megaterium]